MMITVTTGRGLMAMAMALGRAATTTSSMCESFLAWWRLYPATGASP